MKSGFGNHTDKNTCSVNIGNVVAFGLEEDLGMDPLSDQLSTALTIFFVPYVLLQVPSNLLLKRFRPHVWRL